MEVLHQRNGRAAASGNRVGPVVLACVALAMLSLLLPSTLTFDPLTWATWGREIIHLRLATQGGSAWKPLPVLVDVVFAPFGRGEQWAWLVIARAGAVLGVVMVYRLARRVAGVWAGAIAAVGLVLSSSYVDYLTPLGMCEPLLAGLALLALERHLDGHHAQSYALTYACLLLRPEAFAFFAPYSAWLAWRRPRARPFVAAAVFLLPVFWLLPDYLSTADWFRSSQRASMATQGGPLLTGHPAIAVLQSAADALIVPIIVGAAVALLVAIARYRAERRSSVLLILIAVALGWILEEAVITQLRYSAGDQRYLIVGVAVSCVLGGIGLVLAVRNTASWLARTSPITDGPITHEIALAAVAAVTVAACAPFVIQSTSDLSSALGEVPYQTHKYGDLGVAIKRAGGRRTILACPPVVTDIYQMPAAAWQLGLHQSEVVIARGPAGTPATGNIVDVATSGTVLRTRTIRHSPILPARLGSPAFHLVATSDQWEVWKTC